MEQIKEKEFQDKINEYKEKSSKGTLTKEEKDDYDTLPKKFEEFKK